MNEDKDITAIFNNAPPDCFEIIANPTTAIVGQPVIFTGFPDNSDSSIAYYEWDFGCDGWDGKTTSNHIGYIFDSPGTYSLRLRTQNNAGVWSEPGSCPGGVCTLDITVEGSLPVVLEPGTGGPVDWSGGPPIISASNFCAPDGAIGFYFKWGYRSPSGYKESRFDLQISTSTDFSSFAVNSSTTLSTPYDSNHSNDQFVYLVIPQQDGSLNFNQTYYWRVRVWDEYGNGSGWVDGVAFSTPVHPYPYPDFTPSSLHPSKDAEVVFTDNSVCYNDSLQDYPCKNIYNGQYNQYKWNFGNGNICNSNPIPDSLCRGNATTTYNTIGVKTVSLEITDGIGPCTSTEEINVSVPLPQWKEIKPF
jgi:hypothetical protein